MDVEYGIIFGARAILSLIGLVTAFVGFWIKERKWDDLGAIAYEKYKATHDGDVDAYQAANDEEIQKTKSDVSASFHSVTEKRNFHDNGSRDLVRVESSDALDRFPLPRSLQSEVTGALPLPTVMLAGFGLWMLSFIFKPEGGGLYNADWNIVGLVIVAILALFFGFVLRRFTLDRNIDAKKNSFIAIFIATIFLGISGFCDDQVEAPWYFITFGVIFVCSANYSLRICRKMGISWDYIAQPNQDIVFNNGSFFMLIFGLYMLWIGFNAVRIQDHDGAYLPINTGVRAWFTFIAGMGIIVPSFIALEYAFERGSTPVGLYGLNGDTFAHLSKSVTFYDLESAFRVLETPSIFIFGWVMLGFSAFMPFKDFELRQLYVFFLGVTIGPIYALLVLPAYWNGNREDYMKFMYAYCILMISLAIAIGLNGGASLIMSVVSVILILLGQYLDFSEQKRGKAWLEDRKVNENLSIFGIGNPLFIVGWILLCHGLSLP